jgi:hypothetical protein
MVNEIIGEIREPFENEERIMSLGERDNYVNQIDEQIKAKRNMLLEKQKTLKKKTADNEFLSGVQNDYNKYYSYIKTENMNKLKAMETLNQYLDDIITNGKLTDEDIEETRREQEEILGSIDNIKGELDKIISR